MNSRNGFGTVICATLAWATSSAAALGQNDPADCRVLASPGDDSPPSFTQTTADRPPYAGGSDEGSFPSCCFPQWTASAGCIILDRVGGTSQTLVETVPASVKYKDLRKTPGTEILNGDDFQPGFSGGPSLDLIRRDESGYDLELSYFQIDGWNCDRTAGPVNPRVDWLVMRAPGGFIQTNQFPLKPQAMVWDDATELYNTEFNVQWHPSSGVTMLAGFRWVNMRENLLGSLEPPFIAGEPPFWNTTTTNNLFGFQIGADGKILERGRFSIDGLVKAGIFDNNAEQTTLVSIHKIPYASSASTNHAAFVGETGLECRYQLTKSLVLKAGYEVIWLEGVALAPGQIQETYITTGYLHSTVQALGVNCTSGDFYHGATAGLEYSF